MNSEQPRYTLWQAMGAAVELSLRAIEEVRSLARLPAPPGERGKEGPPGKVDKVNPWKEAIHYEGAIVTRDGGLWQARRDTGREWRSDDWEPLAVKGQDGRSIEIRGTYNSETAYSRLDVVARNGGSFVALKDGAGECPGPDWQQWAGQGKTGKPGDPGKKGDRGSDGASVVGGTFDARNMKLLLKRSDGETISIDMYEFALALKDA